MLLKEIKCTYNFDKFNFIQSFKNVYPNKQNLSKDLYTSYKSNKLNL